MTDVGEARPHAAPSAPSHPPGLRVVVVGFDGSPGAVRALEWASAEAERAGARLTVVEAWPAPGSTDHAPAGEPSPNAAPTAAEAARRVAAAHPRLITEQRTGTQAPAPALIAASEHADLLVVGSRGYGELRGLLMGSVGQHLLARAACTVAVVRPPHGRPWRPLGATPGRIVVGVDGSEEANLAVDWAVGAAQRSGARLEILSSWVFPGATGAAPTVAAGLPELARQATDAAVGRARLLTPGVVTDGTTTADPPAAALVERSRRADVLVVGSRGAGPVRGILLGSVSLYLATYAHCPVVVVKAHRGSGR